MQWGFACIRQAVRYAITMRSNLTLLMLAALAATGCTTLDGQHRVETQARHAADLTALQQRTAALEQRIEALEVVREDTYRRLDDIRAGLRTVENDLARQQTAQTEAVQAEAAARETMRLELARSLSERINEIMRAQTAAQPRQRVESGFEHVVKPGETLSEIARAYGVSVNAITRANNIERPDLVRAGQKLFIPE